MNKKEIKERLELLHSVLNYCADHTKTFEIGERIMINQERASLIKRLTFIKFDHAEDEFLGFKVSHKIEMKITNIKSKRIFNIQMPYIFDENEN